MTKFLQKKNIFLVEYKYIYSFLIKKILNIKMYFCNISATIRIWVTCKLKKQPLPDVFINENSFSQTLGEFLGNYH